MESKQDEFLRELKELLTKYDATISFDFDSCSDTHGIYDGGIALYIGYNTPKVEKRVFKSAGWSLDASDL